MKRRILTLILIALAAASTGARRRSVGGTRPCAALKADNVVVVYTGGTSGCASGNEKNCQIGETISFAVTTAGYDAACGEHELVMRFGDARTETRSATGALPGFLHSYTSPGAYTIEATLSNGKSSVKSSQMLLVADSNDDKY